MQSKHFILTLALACACGTTPVAMAAPGAPLADPIARPAQAVRQPARAYLTALAQAGTRIVAVGERGIIILSDDGGVSWRQAAVPSSVSLAAVQFPTPTHGWAVGHYGVILHSRDGGATWSRQLDGVQAAQLMLGDAQAQVQSQAQARTQARTPDSATAAQAYLAEAQRMVADGPDKPFLALHFSDARNGIVVGAYNLALRTRDGGANWTPISGLLDNPGGQHLYAVGAAGDAVYIAGEQGLLLRSTDAGSRFERIEMPYKGSFFALGIADGQVVVGGMGGNVFRSRDDGASWHRIAVPVPVSVTALRAQDGALLMANQAGMLLRAGPAGPVAVLRTPPLAPLSDVLVQPDGAMVAVGMSGAVRLPAPTGAIRDATAAK